MHVCTKRIIAIYLITTMSDSYNIHSHYQDMSQNCLQFTCENHPHILILRLQMPNESLNTAWKHTSFNFLDNFRRSPLLFGSISCSALTLHRLKKWSLMFVHSLEKAKSFLHSSGLVFSIRKTSMSLSHTRVILYPSSIWSPSSSSSSSSSLLSSFFANEPSGQGDKLIFAGLSSMFKEELEGSSESGSFLLSPWIWQR